MTGTEAEVSVRAAGGLIVRGSTPETAEVALVHRPSYDDWTIPKGKEDAGEDPLTCALREVREETGFLCRAVGRAGTSRYQVSEGLKQVEYFLMRPTRFSGFEPNEEVDAVRWLSPDAAREQLTYRFDRDLIAGVDMAAVTAHGDTHLVRHGAAGDRATWSGPDQERPLTRKGRAQAASLAEELSDLGVTRILSSPYVRCMETVEPLAAAANLEVEPTPALAEGASTASIVALLESLRGSTAVLSSHGDVIPHTLDILQEAGVRLLSPFACKKGSTWVVSHDGSSYTEAFYLPPPPDKRGGSGEPDPRPARTH